MGEKQATVLEKLGSETRSSNFSDTGNNPRVQLPGLVY